MQVGRGKSLVPGGFDLSETRGTGRKDLATYLMTFSFTQQGIQNIKDSPERVQAARETIQSFGGEVRAFYAVLGAAYDTMFILDASDDEVVARMALSISSLGNVRTLTHRVFSEKEFGRLVSAMP